MIKQIKKDYIFITVAIFIFFLFAYIVPLNSVNSRIFFQIAFGSGGGGGDGGAVSCGGDAGAGSCAGDAGASSGDGGGSGEASVSWVNVCSVFMGQGCSVTNSCGVSSSGTIDCYGVCSASVIAGECGGSNTVVAPVIQQLCNSAPNSCGQTQLGMAPPSALCPVPPPSDNSCIPPSIGINSAPASGGSGFSGGSDLGISVPGSSRFVSRGNRCSISWNASPATSCTIVGPGVNASGVSGNVKTPRIGIETIGSTSYNITCYNGKVVVASKKFTCRLSPTYEEVL